MAVFKAEDRVEHVSDASLGVGVVRYVEVNAGQCSVYVSWSGVPGVQTYTEAQLRACRRDDQEEHKEADRLHSARRFTWFPGDVTVIRPDKTRKEEQGDD